MRRLLFNAIKRYLKRPQKGRRYLLDMTLSGFFKKRNCPLRWFEIGLWKWKLISDKLIEESRNISGRNHFTNKLSVFIFTGLNPAEDITNHITSVLINSQDFRNMRSTASTIMITGTLNN